MTDKEIFKIKKKINDTRLKIDSLLEELQTFVGIFDDEEPETTEPTDDKPPF